MLGKPGILKLFCCADGILILLAFMGFTIADPIRLAGDIVIGDPPGTSLLTGELMGIPRPRLSIGIPLLIIMLDGRPLVAGVIIRPLEVIIPIPRGDMLGRTT